MCIYLTNKNTENYSKVPKTSDNVMKKCQIKISAILHRLEYVIVYYMIMVSRETSEQDLVICCTPFAYHEIGNALTLRYSLEKSL